jgi:hypothetical protein
MLQTEDGKLIVVAGATRSGKTAWTVREVKKERRALVWDAEDQWAQLPGWKRITSQRELFEAIQKQGNAKLAYVPVGDLKKQFEFWSGCAFHWGRYGGPCVVIAEELADVTNQAKAPGNWGILLRRGLKRGISIYAISQRWAEADKTAVGNASEFILFRMSSGDDIAYMSRKTRVPSDQLEGLQPLEFVRFQVTGEIERGKLKF